MIRFAALAVVLVTSTVLVTAQQPAAKTAAAADPAAAPQTPPAPAAADAAGELRLRGGGPSRSVRRADRQGGPAARRPADRGPGRGRARHRHRRTRRCAGIIQSQGAWVAMISGPERQGLHRAARRSPGGRHDSVDHGTGRDHPAASQRSVVTREAARSAEVPSWWREQVMGSRYPRLMWAVPVAAALAVTLAASGPPPRTVRPCGPFRAGSTAASAPS